MTEEMNKRIAELKELHVRSKPEMLIFFKNLERALNEKSLSKLTHIAVGLPAVLKGYDWVIDELFAEIERLS
jgi:hypothetical protein